MKRIKIAQIGTSTNSHGNFIWNSINKQSDIFEVAGYALPENEREKFPERMADFEGFREMTVQEILSDPTITAVVVETEEIYLTKYAQMAADAGKHIHMEKPGAPSFADFEKLIETIRKNKTVFHTGYMYRYNPYVIELKEKIKNGELGKIISVEAQMNCTHSDEVRKWLCNFPGGMLFFLGCHLIDLIYSIMGEPQEIIPLSCSSGKNGIDTQDFGMVVMKYKNGVSFAKSTDVQVGGFARRNLVVSGTLSTVELCPLEFYAEEGKQFTERTVFDNEAWDNRGVHERSASFDRYDAMMAGFASYVRGDKENPYTLDYELKLFRILLRACGN